MKQLKQYLFSFEIIKGTVMTLSLVLPIYLGIRLENFGLGFCFALGTIFTFLPNTDGSKKHRFWGIIISLLLCLLLVACSNLLWKQSEILFVFYFTVAIFSVSMLAVYGFRGAMIAFSGIMALVMSFALIKNALPLSEQLICITLGGLNYLALASLTHWLFQNRNIALRLAECVEATADFLKLRHRLRWEDTDFGFKLEKKLLKKQIDLNSQHELLRELLFRKRKSEGQSNRTSRFLLIFLELIDLYELSLASGAEIEELKEVFGEKPQYTKPFRDLSAQTIVHLYALAQALKEVDKIPILESDQLLPELCEKNINQYIMDIGLPEARNGAFVLRNLFDLENEKWSKVQSAKRVFANMLEGTELNLKRNDRHLFITAQDYSWNVLKSHLTFKSREFRHALRISIAMLVGLGIGQLFQHQNFYWILLTISVILRPNYGLTKERSINRIIGTIGGAAFGIAVIYLTTNKVIYGILAVPATFIGFTFLQRSYRIAATFITVCIIMLYAILVNNTVSIIAYRVADTLIGSAISFAAIYLLWPTWEENNIQKAILKLLESLRQYLGEIDRIYGSKERPDIAYRLSRKQAFLDCGELLSAFDRLTEEPKSHQAHAAQVYAMVVLNQTFLNAAAAMSTYIQHHTTTPPSDSYKTIMKHILANLGNVKELLEKGEIETDYNKDETEKATTVLELKYKELQNQRAKELETGFKAISPQMRDRLQEAKLIIDQLKWMYSLSESIKQVAVHLR